MFEVVGAAIVGVSLAGLLPGVLATEPAATPEFLAQGATDDADNRTRTAFFCKGGDAETAIPETTLSISRGTETETAAVLLWTPTYFPERAVALDLCQASARRLQELSADQSISRSLFVAERVGEAIRVCLQPESAASTCTDESAVFVTALAAVDPEALLFEMVPAMQRSPRLRGDFPTVHPAFPFSFFRFGF